MKKKKSGEPFPHCLICYSGYYEDPGLPLSPGQSWATFRYLIHGPCGKLDIMSRSLLPVKLVTQGPSLHYTYHQVGPMPRRNRLFAPMTRTRRSLFTLIDHYIAAHLPARWFELQLLLRRRCGESSPCYDDSCTRKFERLNLPLFSWRFYTITRIV